MLDGMSDLWQRQYGYEVPLSNLTLERYPRSDRPNPTLSFLRPILLMNLVLNSYATLMLEK